MKGVFSTFSFLHFEDPTACTLLFAHFTAGFFDSVCGGGGLISTPMYLSAGVPADMVVGTNQCSSLVGFLVVFYKFVKNGKFHFPSALPTTIMAILGGWLGAKLNLLLPVSVLQVVMILLLPFIAVFVLANRHFGEENRVEELSKNSLLIRSLLIGLIIGGYQGFYGAGAGTFFILAFCLLDKLDMITAGGNTKLVLLFAILSASVTYALSAHVLWSYVPGNTLANILGSYIGAVLALKGGTKVAKPMFLAVIVILFVRVIAVVLF